jgi:hypothetical protein
MATLSVTVDDTLVPKLVPILRAELVTLGVDPTGMTDAQIGRAWIRTKLRLAYEDAKAQQASEQEAATAIQTARQTARTEAGGIT